MVKVASKGPILALAVLWIPGCYSGLDAWGGGGPGAEDGAADGADGGGDSDGSADPEALCNGEPLQLGDSSLLRLTRAQYGNALHDLLGVQGLADTLASELPADEKIGAFAFNDTGVPSLLADVVLRNAEAVAEDFVSRMAAALPCSTQAADQACAEAFIDDVGPRAFRRPLESPERDRLVAVFETGADQDFAEGIRRLVTAMLASPSFIYRVELGSGEPTPGELFRLSDYEVATRLSLFLWNTIPDQELLDAAGMGELATAKGRRAQASRLLADPRARDSVAAFALQWVGVDGVAGIDRDTDLYPEFTSDLGEHIRQETADFVAHVVFEDDASFETLMTAPYTIAADDVLRLYGSEPEPGRDVQEPVELDPAQRGGLLTHTGFLAATAHRDQASPILRGVSVRSHVLCEGLPPPPPDANDVPPDVDPDATTRERFSQHTEDPSCAGCHILIDPVGFGFSNYDALGQFHDTENGKPIDASGELVNAGDISGPFDGAVELGARVAQSELARHCFVEQWFVFANGRRMQEVDSCELDLALEGFVESELDIQDLILAVVASPAFTHRVVADTAED